MFIKMAIEIVDLPINSCDFPSCFVCLPIAIWVDLAAMIIQHIQLFGARWLRCRTTVVDSAKSHQSSVKHLIQLLPIGSMYGIYANIGGILMGSMAHHI